MVDFTGMDELSPKKEMTPKDKFEAYLKDNYEDGFEREIERYKIAFKLGQCLTYPGRFDELIKGVDKNKAEAIKSAVKIAGYDVGAKDNTYFLKTKSGKRIKMSKADGHFDQIENGNNKAFFEEALGVDFNVVREYYSRLYGQPVQDTTPTQSTKQVILSWPMQREPLMERLLKLLKIKK